MARLLKVYRAELDGLHDWIVAAPNRRAALDALGVRQDLFAQGEAREEADAEALAAARKTPGIPLRRSKGSKDAFAPVDGLGDWSAAIPKERRAKAKPKPDKARLHKAQAALTRLDADHAEAMQRIAEERAQLDEREAAEAKRYGDARKSARAALNKARG